MADSIPAALSIQPIRHAEDFRQVLARPRLAQSAHFSVHHWGPSAGDLSSAGRAVQSEPVDKSLENPVDKLLTSSRVPRGGVRIGLVVPKRLARRAVTRNLLRRQMRSVFQERVAPGGVACAGLWVLRLRAPFDPKQYPSATSMALRRAARAELQSVIGKAVQRCGGEGC